MGAKVDPAVSFGCCGARLNFPLCGETLLSALDGARVCRDTTEHSCARNNGIKAPTDEL